MQEQVSKKPLVDILSAMVGSVVVMSEDKYVYLDNKIEVSASELAEAIAEQDRLFALAKEESIKAEAELQIQAMTVITESGKEFYADPSSRADISEAIGIAQDFGQTTVDWKLTKSNDPQTQTVSLDELKEARLLALQKYAQLKGIV